MARTSSAEPVAAVQSAAKLLTAVATIADGHPALADRRKAMLTALGEAVEADGGVWAWGRGWPDSTAVVPVAHIDFGFDDRRRAAFMEWALDPEVDRSFRSRVLVLLAGRRQATTLWRDLYTPAEWDASPVMRGGMSKGGWSGWLHSVRYDGDTWSALMLLRNAGGDDFGRPEADAVDLALSAIPWLHATAEEYLPPEAFAGLTPRQRTVMLMLLDGSARKAIAYKLGIGEETVGDHLKAIYAHFAVGSASELAALFLRGR